MICIEVEFLAGRYHATPWGHHVNEGIPEWPPSPYRIARALVDAWHRRHPDWGKDRVLPVLQAIHGAPKMSLPPSTSSHIRVFLDTNALSPTPNRQKIFDSFVAVQPGAKAFICWEDRALSPEQAPLLNTLLQEIGYLGRSESMVRMRLLESPPDVSFNAEPLADGEDGSTAATVACLRGPEEYDPATSVAPNKGEKRRKSSTGAPLSWLDALAFGSADLLALGCNAPPLLKEVPYRVRVPARAAPPPGRHAFAGQFHEAFYTLDAKVLPRATETVALAERVRVKLMGIHRRLSGGDPRSVSSCFSGKERDGTPRTGHQHAFYLPLDLDRDGFLDHLLVTARDAFSPTELAALDRLDRLWQSDGRGDIACVLSGLGKDGLFRRRSRVWQSATPFVPTRFHHAKDGPIEDWVVSQVMQECRHHGLPQPAHVDLVEASEAGVRYRWFEFLRSRKGEKPRHGFGVRVVFSEDVQGPFSLGYGCHFGLGLFMEAAASV